MLAQARCFGLYFSPVNFYFCYDDNIKNNDAEENKETGQAAYMLAEVSNTPWNERHYYLVDLKAIKDTQKAFHVSGILAPATASG